MPTGPVTVVKAWIEMIHRYLAMSIGVLIVALMAISWRRWLKSKGQDSKFSPMFPTLLFAFVCLQGAFGAWTVTMKLKPVIVSTHLLLGMGLLALFAWFGARQSNYPATSEPTSSLRVPAALATALLVIQISLGGWVSTNYAALACTDFPLCNGIFMPSMDFANGFTLWRNLGMTANGEYLPLDALTAIHWTHRTFAFLVTAMIAWVAYCALKRESLRKTARWLLIAVVLQFTIGVANIFLQLPLLLAVLHNGGAALLLLLLVILNYRIRS
jgi:cytochrome c oxidase assembly protein subunit 15